MFRFIRRNQSTALTKRGLGLLFVAALLGLFLLLQLALVLWLYVKQWAS